MNKAITIECESKEKAEKIINDLAELIKQYDHATIADLYEIVGKHRDIQYMDYKYGWTDMSKMHIKINKDSTCYVKFGKPSIVF